MARADRPGPAVASVPDLPRLNGPVPGPRSRELAALLHQHECPGVTYVTDDWPVFWTRASGAMVEDADGNWLMDLLAGFGVASVGHSHPDIVAAGQRQINRLSHGMGDVHPTELKIDLARRLGEWTPGRLQHVLFSCNGSDAVESALKAAMLATGKPGVLAFRGAYHGLSYGTLEVTSRDHFRKPFRAQRAGFAYHVAYPYCYRCPLGLKHPGCGLACLDEARQALADLAQTDRPVGAILVEPIQGRGGCVVPPPEFLAELRRLADDHDALLIADEVYTGFGRTGRQFAVERCGVVPDLMCVGKGMSGGVPMSACIGTPEVMGAWGESQGEAVHTSTFLGNPLGCACSLACLDVIEHEGLVDRADRLGAWLIDRLSGLADRFPCIGDVRGLGLMVGVELVEPGPEHQPDGALAWRVVQAMLRRGAIVLTEGEQGQVISFTPPLTITEKQLDWAVQALADSLTEAGGDATP